MDLHLRPSDGPAAPAAGRGYAEPPNSRCAHADCTTGGIVSDCLTGLIAIATLETELQHDRIGSTSMLRTQQGQHQEHPPRKSVRPPLSPDRAGIEGIDLKDSTDEWNRHSDIEPLHGHQLEATGNCAEDREATMRTCRSSYPGPHRNSAAHRSPEMKRDSGL